MFDKLLKIVHHNYKDITVVGAQRWICPSCIEAAQISLTFYVLVNWQLAWVGVLAPKTSIMRYSVYFNQTFDTL